MEGFRNNTLLKRVKTKDVAREILDLLDIVESESYIKKGTKGGYKKRKVLELLSLPEEKKVNEKELFDSLRGILNEADVITLRVAVSLDLPDIANIYSWFEKANFKNFLLDFEIADNIYGGCQIMHKGKFLDLSLKNKIKEYVSKGRK